MSTNLGQSHCDCGHQFHLTDFIGKPMEIRRYSKYAPQPGVRLGCPVCGTAYFAWIERRHEHWGRDLLPHVDSEEIPVGNGRSFTNHHVGQFVFRDKDGNPYQETGTYRIDLAYYETYRDEPSYNTQFIEDVRAGRQEPNYLCKDDAEETWLK